MKMVFLFTLLPIIPSFVKYGFQYKAVFPVQKEILSNETCETFCQNRYEARRKR